MSKQAPSIKTPLKRAEGLGSAHDGVHHWLMQRVTAVAMIPLLIWFAASVISLVDASNVDFHRFFKHPANAVLMALLIAFSFYHAALGLQEVVEDYVHSKLNKTIALLIINFGLLLLGSATVLAIVKLHLV